MQGHDGHDEILASGAVVKVGGFHRSGAGDGALRVVQDVGSGVRAHAVIGAWEAQGLLDHRRTARNTRCGVVLGVWDEGRTHTEDQLRVNFAVGVFSGVEQRHIKFRGGDFAVGHRDVGLEVSDFGTWRYRGLLLPQRQPIQQRPR